MPNKGLVSHVTCAHVELSLGLVTIEWCSVVLHKAMLKAAPDVYRSSEYGTGTGPESRSSLTVQVLMVTVKNPAKNDDGNGKAAKRVIVIPHMKRMLARANS